MRRIVIIAVVVMVIAFAAGIASAAAVGGEGNSLRAGQLGLNFETTNTGDNMIFGKYFIDKDLALLGGFGFGIHGADGEGTDISIGAGLRKYLRTSDLAPFVGGLMIYRETNDSDNKDFSLLAQFGAEYFLAKQLSIEGSVAFGYTSTEISIGGESFKDTVLGTSRSGVSVNYYF